MKNPSKCGQCKRLKEDLTKTIQTKVQQTLQQNKHVFTEGEYQKLYPPWVPWSNRSKPGAFYGFAKVHKRKQGEGLNEISLNPIVSNIETTIYETAKYLAKLLSTLGQSDNTVTNAPDFIKRIKKETIPEKYKMKSFDVKSFFTNVAWEETISIISRKKYNESKIITNTPRKTMRKFLRLCIKNIHFTFNGEMYVQVDEVAIGSPLDTLLANILMIILEENLISALRWLARLK